MMFELISSLIIVLYVGFGFLYCSRMEGDIALKRQYKARSDRDWSEICFAIGMAWPFGALLHYIMRRRN